MTGVGHVMDMNKRMKQNRSLRLANKDKFKSHDRDNVYAEFELTSKKIPSQQLKRIKYNIRQRFKKERRREVFIFIIAALLVLACLGAFLIHINLY